MFVSAVLPNRNHLRTDLSVTLFLSPKASYDGGELVVENDFGSQTVKLDRTIQKLTSLDADGDCLVRLTAHYHALLRFWAHT